MSEPRNGQHSWIRRLPGKSKNQERPGKSRQDSPDANRATSSTQSNSLTSMELYGLFEFPSRTDQPEPPSLHPSAQSVDIIAVHGLGGSWRTTWSAGKDDNPTIWLRDRLPEVLARVNVHPRIRAFGYDSSYVFTSSVSDLESCAEDLLTRIRIMRQTKEEKQAPIIFVAHSLGGLIVKQAINIAHMDNEYHQDVLDKTAGCLFLAVPFHGSDAASCAQLGSQILSALSLGMVGNSALPSALKRNSKDWMRISRDFVQRGKSMTFRSAYETERMGRSRIVDEASVRNNMSNERVFPVPGSNHRNICKYDEHENERFGPIGLAVTEITQVALDVPGFEFPIMSSLSISTPTFYGRDKEFQEISSTLDPTKGGRKVSGIGTIANCGAVAPTHPIFRDSSICI